MNYIRQTTIFKIFRDTIRRRILNVAIRWTSGRRGIRTLCVFHITITWFIWSLQFNIFNITNYSGLTATRNLLKSNIFRSRFFFCLTRWWNVTIGFEPTLWIHFGEETCNFFFKIMILFRSLILVSYFLVWMIRISTWLSILWYGVCGFRNILSFWRSCRFSIFKLNIIIMTLNFLWKSTATFQFYITHSFTLFYIIFTFVIAATINLDALDFFRIFTTVEDFIIVL